MLFTARSSNWSAGKSCCRRPSPRTCGSCCRCCGSLRSWNAPHDLVCHIASRADRIPGSELSPRCRELIKRMDELACGMWRRAADCWCQRDGSAASALAEVDHELDELHASLVAELASGTMALPVTLE